MENELARRYRETRARTEAICEPLEIEDHCVQSMPDVSPPKWHLGHTTWFFERMFLGELVAPARHDYDFVFNSYYECIGPRVNRADRGRISRPTLREIKRYRERTDGRVVDLLPRLEPRSERELRAWAGIHHEQQHQELLVTDIKHIAWTNPLQPRIESDLLPAIPEIGVGGEIRVDECRAMIGASDSPEFHFDNEQTEHAVLLRSFRISSSPITCGEFLEFVAAGVYNDPRYWLSEGWLARTRELWQAPLYWTKRGGEWWRFEWDGVRPVRPGEPVCHLSFYEADAFARWRGARLPTEFEWEHACKQGLLGFVGTVWEWTSSPYLPYPGYQPFNGPLAEYNGKFMSNQMVLRGGSLATPLGHCRPTYRNFFPPSARWQFSGMRLAWDAERE